MVNGKKVVVVMPAYNAEKTLEKTYKEIAENIVDEIILVDDNSKDGTYDLAKKIGIQHVIKHDQNKGYGANQKTCYNKALDVGADIVIMLHPDYQYTPMLIPAMAHMLASGLYEAVLASRILGNGALKGGMPLYKYIANRFLTLFQNIMMGQKLSEYHTGYRGFTKKILQNIGYTNNSDDFVFDNQMLAQVACRNYAIAEITCPTKYFKEASSINFRRSVTYGIGVLQTSLAYFLHKNGLKKSALFKEPQTK